MVEPSFSRDLSDREIAKQARKIKVWKVLLYMGLLGLLFAAQYLITKFKYG